MNNSRYILTFILLLCSAPALRAGSGLVIGYSGGIYTTHLPNLKVEAFELERTHAYWDDKFKINSFFSGLTVQYLFNFNQGAFFFMYSQRRSVFDAGGVNPADGYKEKYKMKARGNYFSFMGIQYSPSENFSLGLTMDAGNFKLFYKWDKSTEAVKDYELVYGTHKGLLGNSYRIFGNTMYAEAGAERIKVRLSWFFDWFGCEPGVYLTDYVYKSSSLSLGLMFKLFGD
ncbi:MAG TPA: hypothetical protein VI112_17290 [Bacteroidia bacterium]|jgi:hypothetical protein